MTRVLALISAAHPGPAAAVTVLAGLLASTVGHDVSGLVAVVAAVLAGQLTIGWSNDLLDARRDRIVERRDKPLATGELSAGVVALALGVAATAAVVASARLGAAAGLTHLVLLVGGGLAYNLGLKSTFWSWLPYAVAFGSLPAVVTLALDPPAVAPAWMLTTGALLGVGAHLLNVLPDLDDDARTGVRGFPHRLGAAWARRGATGVLVLASAVVVVAQPRVPGLAWVAVAAVAGLAIVALRGAGKLPFRAAMGIALIDVALLTALGGSGRLGA